MLNYVPIKNLINEIGDNRYIVVGDIHGCVKEFNELLGKVGFNDVHDYLICVGDLVDRGPDSKTVVDWFMSHPKWFSVMGNHDDRFLRFLKGNNVKHTHGLEETITNFGDSIKDPKYIEYFSQLPYIIQVPHGYVVHGGFNPTRAPDKQTREDCIFSRYFDGRNYFDNNAGSKYWFEWLPQTYPSTFSGHEVHEKANCQDRHYYTVSPGGQKTHVMESDWLLDGGCCFGFELRCWDSKIDNIVSVPSKMPRRERTGEELKRSEKHYTENKEKSYE